MNAEQLQKTLRASQYAEQVLSIHQVYLEQDYAIDQFSQPLTTEQIFDVVQNTLKEISDETTWMRTIAYFTCAFNVSLDLAGCQSTHRCDDPNAGAL